jgi:transposase-like protein
MRTDHFKRLLNKLDELTGPQQAILRRELALRSKKLDALEVVESAKTVCSCTHCESNAIVKNGFNRGLQRYLCRHCGKTFNVASATPLSKLRHKGQFLQNAECMLQSLSIRATAKKIGIAVSTAFRWRHRFLENVVGHQPKHVTGLLEADEMYLHESFKGSRHMPRKARRRGLKQRFTLGRSSKPKGRNTKLIPVMVGRLRGQPHVADCVLEKMNGDETLRALKEVISSDTLLCTDGNPAFLKIQRELGIPVKSVATRWHGPVLDKIYHVQSVNSYHERLKTWLQRKFRGVATKYLSNYLAWRRVLEWFKDGIRPEHLIKSALGKQIINA